LSDELLEVKPEFMGFQQKGYPGAFPPKVDDIPDAKALAAKRVFIVCFKEGSYRIISQTAQNAMRDFMRRVMVEQIGIEELGQIGTVLEEGGNESDTIAFRIAPAMFNLGKIDLKTYLEGLRQNISPEISMADAMRIAKKDRWLTEVVK